MFLLTRRSSNPEPRRMEIAGFPSRPLSVIKESNYVDLIIKAGIINKITLEN